MTESNFEANIRDAADMSLNAVEGRIVKGIGGFYYVDTPLGQVTQVM